MSNSIALHYEAMDGSTQMRIMLITILVGLQWFSVTLAHAADKKDGPILSPDTAQAKPAPKKSAPIKPAPKKPTPKKPTPRNKPAWHLLKGELVTPSQADTYYKARQQEIEQKKASKKKAEQEKAVNSKKPNSGQ